MNYRHIVPHTGNARVSPFIASVFSSRKFRATLMLLLPLLTMAAYVALVQPQALVASVQYTPDTPASPSVSPPGNLQIISLDSSFHVTWDPSTDPATAWHVVSVWDGSDLQQSKVVGKTARAAQTNGLLQAHTYTVKVQAMDAQGNLSTPISTNATTDPQSPMRNAAFFENFNGGHHGDLDYDYFDVRTSHGSGLRLKVWASTGS